jgi:CheY-like chemotaxis protein
MLTGRRAMPTEKAKLLIVDDVVSIRTSLSILFARSGYRVRSAQDGFSALAEIRNEIPDILLSDLSMPGMSGFELLSVVRRRFPVIRVIAMSGAFSGGGVPSGVAADVFYEKGTDLGALLQMMEGLPSPERPSFLQHSTALAPIWIPSNGSDSSGEAYVMITCPECFRAFPQTFGEAPCLVHETACSYCHSLIHYAVVPPTDPASTRASQEKLDKGMPTLFSGPRLSLNVTTKP